MDLTVIKAVAADQGGAENQILKIAQDVAEANGDSKVDATPVALKAAATSIEEEPLKINAIAAAKKSVQGGNTVKEAVATAGEVIKKESERSDKVIGADVVSEIIGEAAGVASIESGGSKEQAVHAAKGAVKKNWDDMMKMDLGVNTPTAMAVGATVARVAEKDALIEKFDATAIKAADAAAMVAKAAHADSIVVQQVAGTAAAEAVIVQRGYDKEAYDTAKKDAIAAAVDHDATAAEAARIADETIVEIQKQHAVDITRQNKAAVEKEVKDASNAASQAIIANTNSIEEAADAAQVAAVSVDKTLTGQEIIDAVQDSAKEAVTERLKDVEKQVSRPMEPASTIQGAFQNVHHAKKVKEDAAALQTLVKAEEPKAIEQAQKLEADAEGDLMKAEHEQTQLQEAHQAKLASDVSETKAATVQDALAAGEAAAAIAIAAKAPPPIVIETASTAAASVAISEGATDAAASVAASVVIHDQGIKKKDAAPLVKASVSRAKKVEPAMAAAVTTSESAISMGESLPAAIKQGVKAADKDGLEDDVSVVEAAGEAVGAAVLQSGKDMDVAVKAVEEEVRKEGGNVIAEAEAIGAVKVIRVATTTETKSTEVVRPDVASVKKMALAAASAAVEEEGSSIEGAARVAADMVTKVGVDPDMAAEVAGEAAGNAAVALKVGTGEDVERLASEIVKARGGSMEAQAEALGATSGVAVTAEEKEGVTLTRRPTPMPTLAPTAHPTASPTRPWQVNPESSAKAYEEPTSVTLVRYNLAAAQVACERHELCQGIICPRHNNEGKIQSTHKLERAGCRLLSAKGYFYVKRNLETDVYMYRPHLVTRTASNVTRRRRAKLRGAGKDWGGKAGFNVPGEEAGDYTDQRITQDGHYYLGAGRRRAGPLDGFDVNGIDRSTDVDDDTAAFHKTAARKRLEKAIAITYAPTPPPTRGSTATPTSAPSAAHLAH